MTEADWRHPINPWQDLQALADRVSDRKLRLFVCAGCREVWPTLTDERTRTAVEIAELYA